MNTNIRVLENHFATTYEGFLKTNKSLFITIYNNAAWGFKKKKLNFEKT